MEKSVENLLREKVDELISKALLNRVFTGCSLGVFSKEQKRLSRYLFHYGHSGHGKEQREVDDNSVFDLASLTKPLVTSLSLLPLIEEGLLSLDDSLEGFFDISIPGHELITVQHLLTHSSGLPAHKPFYRELFDIPEEDRKKKLVQSILSEELLSEPGREYLYSDLGFMLLGEIVEQISGKSLNLYWQQKIFNPLAIDGELFFPGVEGAGWKGVGKNSIGENIRYVATGSNSKVYQKGAGVVNDENCRSLGGVAGHAGLFGTCSALLTLMERLLRQYRGEEEHPSYSSEIFRKLLTNKQGGWRFGFDTPTSGLSSSGHYFSEMTIGHLGFTGTSFWLDLKQEIGIVFLTNRVISDGDVTEIKRLRPQLHDLIMETLIKKSG